MQKTVSFILSFVFLNVFIFGQVKIGVINSDEIMQKSKRGKQSLGKLEDLKTSKQQKIQSLQKEYLKLKNEVESPALNDDARQKKVRELEDKQVVLQRLVNDARTEMQKETRNELLALRNEILPIIHQIGKAKGFTLILEMNETGVVYYDKTIDITADVINAMDTKL